jgi:hypothetical protein
MPILARHLALAVCVTFVGSVADAAPKRRGGRHTSAKRHEVARLADRDVEEMDDDEEDEDNAEPEKAAKASKHHDEDEDDDDDEEEVEDDEDADDDDDDDDRKRKRKRARRKAVAAESDSAALDVPLEVRKRGVQKGLRDWNFAIGPNVWMASVDANVAVGAKDVGTAIDFFQISRNTRYGVPILAEARYKRFSFTADLLYGVVDVAGANEVGPLMVTLDGTISSLLADGQLGFRLLGGDDKKLTVEARAGVRYQRTVINGAVGVDGSEFSTSIVDKGGDLLAGARVVVRPWNRFFLSGTVDQSVVGSSTSTWSAGADANIRITSRVLLAAGWRTLTQQRAAISTVMHGPRAAIQLLF